MAVTKKIQIQNPAGTGFDSRDIGAEGQYIEVSRDSNGNIIEDITASGVVVDSTESLTETLKNIEDNKQDELTFDDTPTSGSTNPVTSDGVYQALQNVDIDVDSAMSTTSEKPVQNKVITGAINKRVPNYNESPSGWDTTPTQNSTKPITSGGVYDALQGVGANDNFIGTVAEWEALTDTQKAQYKTVDFTDDFNGATIDAVPTQNSTNAVSSGGMYDVVDPMLNVLGAKNILPNHAIPQQVIQGITFTVNSDGSVTLNGTPSGNTGIEFGDFILPKGTYKVTSGQSQELNSEVFVFVRNISLDAPIARSNDDGYPSTFTLENDTAVRTGIYRFYNSSSEPISLTIYPMIRPASIKDDTYVPYAPINRNCAEKTDLASIRATGTTNATGAVITSGTYFYLNNTLVQAKVNIASGATFTLDTNYEIVTAGALNKKGAINFNRSMAAYSGAYTGSPISGSIDYTLTEDSWMRAQAGIGGGYFQIFANGSQLLVNWSNYITSSSVGFSDWILLPKGTRVTSTITADVNKVYSYHVQFFGVL